MRTCSCGRWCDAQQCRARIKTNEQRRSGKGQKHETMRNIFHEFYRTNIGAKVKTKAFKPNERTIMQLPITDAHKASEVPTLNASEIPHAVRHGAIHGALGTLNVGEAMILIAPHNPVPLLKEIEAREESFALEYLKEQPQDFHIKFTRVA